MVSNTTPKINRLLENAVDAFKAGRPMVVVDDDGVRYEVSDCCFTYVEEDDESDTPAISLFTIDGGGITLTEDQIATIIQ